MAAAHGTVPTLKRGVHASLLYDAQDDPIALVAPYVQAGLRAGERCLYVVGEHDPARIRDTFARHGIAVGEEEARGALVLVTHWEVSFPGGEFDPSAMIGFVRDASRATIADGFTALRVVAEMSWALQMGVGCDRLIHYEALGNGLYPDEPLGAICMYDRRRFPAEVCADAIRTHPVVALGERLHRNSYYELPDAACGGTSPEQRLEWMCEQLRLLRAADEDRRERVRAEVEVRVRDEFVAIAAHELRTPLAALSANVELLTRKARSGTLDEATLLDLLARLRRQTDRQTRLVDELLDGSRVATGTLSVTTERVDVAGLVREVADRYRDMRGLVIDAPRVLEAMVDPLRIEQVLTNLLENARRHCPPGTPVAVSLSERDTTFHFEVRDNGPGIAAADRPRIFDRYHRTASAGGLGLGLHISRQIAELHGGHLTVDFPEDGGSRFSLVLPRA